MDRYEFINELRKSMAGHFSAAEIQETVDYYEDYIDMQLRKGRSEQDVLTELGDPRLLTRSMRAAGRGNNTGMQGGVYESYEATGDYHGKGSGMQPRVFHVPCIIWILILLVILVIIGAVVGFVLRILLYVLPFFVLAGLLYSLYRYFVKK